MPEKNERYDAFAVPRNFGEDGISFNGLSRRNLAEGCILAAATGYLIAFHLSADLSLRIILLCFVSLPLFFIGLIGYGGESLSQFVVTVVRFLFRRRRLRYYIDTGEPEPPKVKGWKRVKLLFHKQEEHTVRYKKRKTPRKQQGPDLFDRLFFSRSGKKAREPAEEAPKTQSRKIYNMAQEFFPVADIRGGHDRHKGRKVHQNRGDPTHQLPAAFRIGAAGYYYVLCRTAADRASQATI